MADWYDKGVEKFQETIEKYRRGSTGRKASEETRAKMRNNCGSYWRGRKNPGQSERMKARYRNV